MVEHQGLVPPRKMPSQARARRTVDLILEASAQILANRGEEALTTNHIAERAGFSIGTLYQYFPNKSALLQAVLKRHLGEVTETVELVCEEQRGRTLRQMAMMRDAGMPLPETSAMAMPSRSSSILM